MYSVVQYTMHWHARDQLYICTSICLQLLTSHILIVPHSGDNHLSDPSDDDYQNDDDDDDDDDNRKKVELIIWLFDLCWEMRFSNFSLGTFEKVEPFVAQDETSDETYTLSKIDISGSNETKQKVLASIV